MQRLLERTIVSLSNVIFFDKGWYSSHSLDSVAYVRCLSPQSSLLTRKGNVHRIDTDIRRTTSYTLSDRSGEQIESSVERIRPNDIVKRNQNRNEAWLIVDMTWESTRRASNRIQWTNHPLSSMLMSTVRLVICSLRRLELKRTPSPTTGHQWDEMRWEARTCMTCFCCFREGNQRELSYLGRDREHGIRRCRSRLRSVVQNILSHEEQLRLRTDQRSDGW